MGKRNAFERDYSINVARLSNGNHEMFFEIGRDFFEHLEYSLIKDGDIKLQLEIVKYNTHLDVKFNLSGKMVLECDRCTQPYDHDFSAQHRMIYSFDKDMEFENTEVMFTDRMEPELVLVQEIYDFINMSVPIRRVPPKEVHVCAPEVLTLLGIDPEEEEFDVEEEEFDWEDMDDLDIDEDEFEDDDDDSFGEETSDTTDPRWDILKNLRNQMDEE
ncbi:MAG: hypothetical protein SF052_18610 [Bacteroidia bacterium]|nr:hypothetical protein [Bacteroidia bacterium]